MEDISNTNSLQQCIVVTPTSVSNTNVRLRPVFIFAYADERSWVPTEAYHALHGASNFHRTQPATIRKRLHSYGVLWCSFDVDMQISMFHRTSGLENSRKTQNNPESSIRRTINNCLLRCQFSRRLSPPLVQRFSGSGSSLELWSRFSSQLENYC